ncbi:MAG: hypothetical protein RLZZ455_31 [Candidatus Parcubacteria bacterium]|jgi:single-stranded-DNA-specific exonuclease
MKWELKNGGNVKGNISTTEELLAYLLTLRGIVTEEQKAEFVFPKLEAVNAKSVGIDKKQLQRSVLRIQNAIEKGEQIIIFGDYDVDGICASAILWETLHHKTAKVMPYIPHRVDEGYGLSVSGITNVLTQYPETTLIITVDNGIVANEAVTFAKSQNIDVIITDHHLPHEDEKHVLPDAFSIVHTTKLCGAGIAWVVAKEFIQNDQTLLREHLTDHLVFAALATIADMVPLIDGNRAIVKFGLPELRKTTRVGLRALFAEAGIEQRSIEVYQIGHQISPRLNAAGRMESAMDSLRLLCTRDSRRAKELADALGEVNRFRQEETMLATEHAIGQLADGVWEKEKILLVAHESYPQGVIGLIAGKLVEKYYRPAIVIAIGNTQSKASVRSIKGFNIIEFLRTQSEYFVNVGGHPMAAGFTIETEKITLLKSVLERAAGDILTEEQLTRSILVDVVLPYELITQETYEALKTLAPFGIGNPEPVFSSSATIADIRILGREGKHLKLKLSDGSLSVDAIGFGMGERVSEIKVGDMIDVAFNLDENEWNGRKSLQLKLKDFVKKS